MEKKPRAGTKLVRFFLSGAILSVSRLFVGLLRNKYLAVAYGAAGVGVLSQGVQLQQLAITIASLSIATGMIQRILSSVREGDSGRQRRVLATSFWAMAASTGVVLLPFFLAAPYFAELFFDRREMVPHLFCIIASVPLYVMTSSYLEAQFFSANRYDLSVKASIASAVLGLFAFVGLTYFFGVFGVFLSQPVAAFIFLLTSLYYLRSFRSWGEIFVFRGFCWNELAVLVRYSVVLLVGGAVSFGVSILLRTITVQRFGVETNGLVQVSVALSAYYSSLLTNLMWSRLMPRASSLGDSEHMREEFAHIFEFLTHAQAAMAVGVMAALEILIRVIYTKEFLGAAQMVSLYLLGDFFYFSMMAFSVYMLGLGRGRAYLSIQLVFNLLFAGGALFLATRLGAQFYSSAYLFASVLVGVPVLGTLIWRGHFSAAQVLRMCGCGFVLALQCLLLYQGAPAPWRFLIGVLFAAYVLWHAFQAGWLRWSEGRPRLGF